MAGRRPSVWGGVLGISAVSRPCPRGSRCSPLTVPDPGSSLGGKRWWQSPRAEVLGGTSPRAGLSGFYLPCWLAQLMSSWPQPPDHSSQLWVLKSPGDTLYPGFQAGVGVLNTSRFASP